MRHPLFPAFHPCSESFSGIIRPVPGIFSKNFRAPFLLPVAAAAMPGKPFPVCGAALAVSFAVTWTAQCLQILITLVPESLITQVMHFQISSANHAAFTAPPGPAPNTGGDFLPPVSTLQPRFIVCR